MFRVISEINRSVIRTFLLLSIASQCPGHVEGVLIIKYLLTHMQSEFYILFLDLGICNSNHDIDVFVKCTNVCSSQ